MLTYLPKWAKVVLTAAPTWIGFAVLVLTGALEALPDGFPEVAEWIGRIIVWLGGAAAIINRVTPVAKDERGVVT